jgi:hypothetical protein
MFKITSTRAITWPEFSLRKGENVFPSRKAVPVELWKKLDRFRVLKLLDFEGAAEAGKDEAVKLEELSQRQLYAMSKTDLLELAKSSSVLVAEDGSKAVLIAELEKRLAPGAIAAAPAPEEQRPAIVGAAHVSTIETTSTGRRAKATALPPSTSDT